MKFLELIGLIKEGKSTLKSHMKNLLEMAMIDNHFDEKEYQLMKELAKKYRVSQKELQNIQENPNHVEFVIPKNEDEKFEHFYELVNMMIIDGEILVEEENLCTVFAKKFGFKQHRELVKAVSQNIKYGQPWHEAKERVKLLL